MEDKKQTIDDLIKQFHGYLIVNGRCDRTILEYRSAWLGIQNYMLSNNLALYDKSAETGYLASIYGKYDYYKLSVVQKKRVNAVEALLEFQETGSILTGARIKKTKEFTCFLGKTMTDYIAFRANNLSLSKASIHTDTSYAYKLFRFLTSKAVIEPGQITHADIVCFISLLDPTLPGARYAAILTCKRYLQFLYKNQLTSIDHSKSVPSGHYDKQPRLPSTYSKEEIGILLRSIDRGNPKGKRDYAILLFAIRLGLRASDIAALKFENISWESQSIYLQQGKTGKGITLPLLPDIGNAMIDYMKHGRPASEERYCFLQKLGPYHPLTAKDVGALVSRSLKRAGINIRNRKHGAHVLRHSFANNLLRDKVSLPVITEALGHKNTSSTMFYIRIDSTSLKQCTLNVPVLSPRFYAQKGGFHR